MTGSVQLLAAEMDEAWARFRSRLDGPGGDEFLWEPVAHPWTVFGDDAGRWTVGNPGDVASAIAMLEHGHALLTGDLAALTDAALDRMVLTNWANPGPRGGASGP